MGMPAVVAINASAFDAKPNTDGSLTELVMLAFAIPDFQKDPLGLSVV